MVLLLLEAAAVCVALKLAVLTRAACLRICGHDEKAAMECPWRRPGALSCFIRMQFLAMCSETARALGLMLCMSLAG